MLSLANYTTRVRQENAYFNFDEKFSESDGFVVAGGIIHWDASIGNEESEMLVIPPEIGALSLKRKYFGPEGLYWVDVESR